MAREGQRTPAGSPETCEEVLPRWVLGLRTRKQIAVALQVSVGTVDRWRRDGVIPCFYVPGGTKKSKGVIRFKSEEVLEALGRFRVGTSKEVTQS